MSDTSSEPTIKIGVEDYRKILAGLSLENIFLTKSSCEIKRDEASPQSSISINDKSLFKAKDNGIIQVSQEFHLIARNQSSKKKFLDIKYEVCVIYKSSEVFTTEFFETFKDINLPINTWPYFREFVYSMTARMFIPPITLPLLKR